LLLALRFQVLLLLLLLPSASVQLRAHNWGMLNYVAAIALLRVSNDAKMAALTMKPLPMVAPRPFASTPRPSSRMLLAAHCHAL
jgi:hypothetical protein